MDFKAVTLVIDDQQMDVSEVPFPAVTIFGRFPSSWKLFMEILFIVEYFLVHYHNTNETVFVSAAKFENAVAFWSILLFQRREKVEVFWSVHETQLPNRMFF